MSSTLRRYRVFNQTVSSQQKGKAPPHTCRFFIPHIPLQILVKHLHEQLKELQGVRDALVVSRTREDALQKQVSLRWFLLSLYCKKQLFVYVNDLYHETRLANR